MRAPHTLTVAIILAIVSPFVAFAQQATPPSGASSTSSALDPQKGQAIGSVFEAFLSPHQEPGEEKDTPAATPKQFKSTAPSQPRSERTGRGHGMIVPGLRDTVKTISGMESIAQQGELYFNLHTYGQTYYGNVRGKLKPVAK